MNVRLPMAGLAPGAHLLMVVQALVVHLLMAELALGVVHLTVVLVLASSLGS
ncbi:MAG TPA: hypothetical protein VFY83_13530 [Anaerolineales bacterium]|nr:hypothetical protein [Anaerolineales bacterium]